MQKTIKIDGMMCEHCVKRVKKVLEAVDGVESAAVSLEQKEAVVECAETVSEEALRNVVKEAGYTPL